MKKPQNYPDKKLAWTIVLNFAIAGMEATGGVLAGSLSLLSDALHNSSDAFSLFLSLMALKLSRLGNTESRTFGYKRAEILAALLNASLLLIVSFFLFKEAFVRLTHPAPINSRLMILIASVAFAVNTGSALLLRRHAHDNINLFSSYFHLVSDALSSLAVILGGIGVLVFHWNWIDPLLTLLISIYVLVQGYRIINRTLHILMQSTPHDIDLRAIQGRIEKLPEVHNIHHVHVWQMTEQQTYFEAHVNLARDMTVSESVVLKNSIEKLLEEEFRIAHSTLQFEFQACQDVPLVKP